MEAWYFTVRGLTYMEREEVQINLSCLIGPGGIGWAKKCLRFVSTNKRHIFHFHQELC